MKNVLVIIAIICFPMFLSFSKVDESKFIGEWNVLNKDGKIKTIVIKKEVEFYSLTYHSGDGGHQWSTSTYKYKDGSLKAADGAGSVIFIESSHHLKWNGDEWERASDKMK